MITKKARLIAIAGLMFALAQANAAGSDDMATLLFGKASPRPANGTQ